MGNLRHVTSYSHCIKSSQRQPVPHHFDLPSLVKSARSRIRLNVFQYQLKLSHSENKTKHVCT